jgi:hypothetical protein
MKLVRCNKLDAAIALLVVVPLDNCGNPETGIILAGERPVKIVRAALYSSK